MIEDDTGSYTNVDVDEDEDGDGDGKWVNAPQNENLKSCV